VVTDQPFTDTQRWIELLIPGAETGSPSTRPKVTRGASASFNPSRFGATTSSLLPKSSSPRASPLPKNPRNEPWGSIAVFKDPDGNQFALSSKVNHK